MICHLSMNVMGADTFKYNNIDILHLQDDNVGKTVIKTMKEKGLFYNHSAW